MFKKSTYIVAAVVVILLIAGAWYLTTINKGSSTNPPQTPVTSPQAPAAVNNKSATTSTNLLSPKAYVNETEGFSIQLPEDWSYSTGTAGYELLITPRVGSQVAILVQVGSLKSPSTTLDTVVGLMEQKVGSTAGATLLYDTVTTTSQGLQAVSDSYTGPENGTAYTFKDWYFINGGKLYALTCLAPSGDWASYSGLMLQSAQTFKLLQS